jgi:hypothetical protein
MSREYMTYKVTCGRCGHTGSVRYWSDDWHHHGEVWSGFKRPGQYHHIQHRIVDNPPKPSKCEKCASTKVTVAEKPELITLVSDRARGTARPRA